MSQMFSLLEQDHRPPTDSQYASYGGVTYSWCLWNFFDWKMRKGDGSEEDIVRGKVNISGNFYPPSGSIKVAVFPDEISLRSSSGQIWRTPRNDRVHLPSVKILERYHEPGIPSLRQCYRGP